MELDIIIKIAVESACSIGTRRPLKTNHQMIAYKKPHE